VKGQELITRYENGERDFFRANLNGANLSEANLRGADLIKALLRRAKVTPEQLAQTKSLKGATLPDGTKHE
jgi:uncharacterized protein YjbI with pentapeptide repeats